MEEEAKIAEIAEATEVHDTKLFTQTQIMLTSIVAGGVATVYMLYKNYIALNDRAAARNTIIWGPISIIAFCIIVIYLPEKTTKGLNNIGGFMAGGVGTYLTMCKAKEVDMDDYPRQSHWLAVIAGIASLAITLAVAFVIGMVLNIAGLLPAEMSVASPV